MRRRREMLSVLVALVGVVAVYFLFCEPTSRPNIAADRAYPVTEDERLVAAELTKHLPDG